MWDHNIYERVHEVGTRECLEEDVCLGKVDLQSEGPLNMRGQGTAHKDTAVSRVAPSPFIGSGETPRHSFQLLLQNAENVKCGIMIHYAT